MSPADCKLRLEQRDIVLDDGHRVGVSTCGEGVPFVMIHGLGGEGMFYGRMLSRIAALGYQVVAIDTAGHGRTDGLGSRGWRWSAYVDLHHRTLQALGIDRAVLAGHSMGGKLAVDLAARDPHRVLAVIAVNAPLGRLFDSSVAFRTASALIPMQTGLLAVDLTTAAVWARREMLRNAALLSSRRRLVRSAAKVPGAFCATVWDGPSTHELRHLRDHQIPTVLIHGDRDLAVWFASARAAAQIADATLVRVHGGGHVWLLEDTTTLPAIIAELTDDGALPDTPRPPAVALAAARRTWSIDRRPHNDARSDAVAS